VEQGPPTAAGAIDSARLQSRRRKHRVEDDQQPSRKWYQPKKTAMVLANLAFFAVKKSAEVTRANEPKASRALSSEPALCVSVPLWFKPRSSVLHPVSRVVTA